MSINRWTYKRKHPSTGNVTEEARWMVEFWWNGERHRKRFASRRAAEAFERTAHVQMANGTYGAADAPSPTVEQFAPQFLQWSNQHNKPSTAKAKEVILRVHLVPGLGKLRLDARTLRAEVEFYKQRKHVEGLSMKTVNNHLAVLGRLLSLAAEWGLTQQALRLKKLPARLPEPMFLNFEEAEQFIAAAEPEWRTFILVLLKTGVRVGELLALKWRDVDVATGQLQIRATRWNGQECTPKSGKSRTVGLTPAALAALRAHRHLCGEYVFCHGDGRPFTHSEVKNVVPRTCKLAGVKRLTAHGLRHTCASHLIMRGRSIVEVKEVLGHGSLAMVMRYAHLAPSVTRATVQVLDEPAPTRAGA